jgi:hypothetical protein
MLDRAMGVLDKLFRARPPAPPCAIHPDDRDLVRPEDLEWWSGLSLADCQTLERKDSAHRLAEFRKLTETHGLPSSAAGEQVRLAFPTYYRTLEHRWDEKFSVGAPDAKLPCVLQSRVERAMKKRLIDDRTVARTSSFNATVRQLIRAGRI